MKGSNGSSRGVLRKIAAYSVENRTAKVYYDPDVHEYVVKFYIEGGYLLNSDYFTDDRSDALNTANSWSREQQPDAAEH